MDNNILKTSVDDLYELVRSRKKISVEEAAKILRMPIGIVQSLADFLVEERIFGIEYKFTTPFIYMNEKTSKQPHSPVPTPPPNHQNAGIVTKEEFYQKAMAWNLPKERLDALWKKYLSENITGIRDSFYTKARSKNISEEKLANLWEKYREHLQ